MDKMTHRERKTKQGAICKIKNIAKELQEKYYTFLDYTKNEGSAWKTTFRTLVLKKFQELEAPGLKCFGCMFIIQNMGRIVLKIVTLFHFDEPCLGRA